MVATTSIQQETYQAVYDIHEEMGPNNYDLGVRLTYPNRGNSDYVSFGSTNEDGVEIWLDVLLTGLKSLDFEREKWEFEGILWSWELHTKKEAGGRTRRARVKGTYNSHTRKGKLYVLAHEQPKPIVELLSWEEMCKRLNVAVDEGKKVVIEKKSLAYIINRGRLISIEHRDSELDIHVVKWYYLNTDIWKEAISNKLMVEYLGNTRPPLALGDQRILFSNEYADFTVYLSDEGVSCP